MVARRIRARRRRLPVPRKDDLFDPSVAVPLGAAYLQELLDRHAGELCLALAAYNAGPGPVARWLPPKLMDADVWIENIPYGETRSYADIARAIGRPAAVRAVGAANGANPVAIIVPCHRVIGSNGSLTGYGGGLPTKEWLLALEKNPK